MKTALPPPPPPADADLATRTIDEGRDLDSTDAAVPADDPGQAALPAATPSDSDRLLAAIDEGEDPFGILEATAAIAGEPGGEDGGGSFVRLDRILEPTTPLGLDYPRPGRIQEELPRLNDIRTSADGIRTSATADGVPSGSGATPPNLFIADDNGSNARMGGAGHDILLGDSGGIETKFVGGKSYNLNLLVDITGSMKWDWGSNPTGNPSISRLETTKIALKSFLQNHVATHQGGDINVKLITFPEAANNADIPEIIGVNAGNLQPLMDAIDALTTHGGTPYGQAFDKARGWFEQMATNSAYDNYENMTLFLTDGEPNHGNLNPLETEKIRQLAFDKLKAISPKIHAIGLGPDMSQFVLDRYDTTYPGTVPLPDVLNASWALDSSGDQVFKNLANWDQTGTNQAYINNYYGGTWKWINIPAGGSASMTMSQKAANKITITDAAYPNGAYLGFEYATVSSWSEVDGSKFIWRLLKQDTTTGNWLEVESGTPDAMSPGGSEQAIYVMAPGAGDYRFEFEFTRGATQPGADIDLKLGEIKVAPPHPTDTFGQGQQVLDPYNLGITLVNGTATTVPTVVGDDVLNGGDGDDIIFGDALYTGNLPWADVGGMPAGYNKTGLDALDDFLVLKLGLASVADLTDADRYDYIKANHALLHSSTDTIGGHDTLHGGAGNDILYGQGGDDTLYGGAGDDVLYGDMGNDTLYGDEGDDILLGGAGDDTLIGGAGDDIFRWLNGDAGTVTNPAKDIIKDFGNGNDKLDLADLLQGEESSLDLGKFLNFSLIGSDTVLKISTTGVLNSSASNYNQMITLEGVDWVTGMVSQNQLALDLRDAGKLLLDQ